MYSRYRKCTWEEVEIGEVFIDDAHDVFIKVSGLEPGIWLNNMSQYTPRLAGTVIGNINGLGDKITELYKEHMGFDK